MPRHIDTSQGMDPENAAALSGAPRARVNIRENGTRDIGSRRRRKDKFYVPPEAIPKGWCVEWKRVSCLGMKEEVDYEMDLYDAGWKPASPSQFSMLIPEGFEGKTIDRGGMRLYIRPAHMKKEAQRLDHEEAVGQVRDKLQEIGFTAPGEAPRKVQTFSREWDRPASRMVPEDDGNEPAPYEEHEGSDDRSGAE